MASTHTKQNPQKTTGQGCQKEKAKSLGERMSRKETQILSTCPEECSSVVDREIDRLTPSWGCSLPNADCAQPNRFFLHPKKAANI